MIETKSKKIGDVTYRVRQLKATSGRKILVRLLKVFGPALDAVDTKGGINIGALLGGALQGLDEETVDSLCDTFAQQTEFELANGNFVGLGEAGQFDLHFAGKYVEMTQWLVFCVQVNFADFLGVLSAAAKKSAPPATAT